MSDNKVVWVFNGAKGKFPSAVFSKKELAEDWVKRNRLTGTLTAYPLDISVYDWSVSNGYFSPKHDEHRTPDFIGRFSSAYQEHYHYEDGSNE
jgi:hypothetical protein